jgi:hypothetical protein
VDGTVRSYLLETYVSRTRPDELAETAVRVRAAARMLEASGRTVRLVRSTFVPADEVGFLAFEAESADVVGEVADAAAIVYERIVETVESGRRVAPLHPNRIRKEKPHA